MQAELGLDPRAISRFRARAMLLETAAWPKDVFYEVSGAPPNTQQACASPPTCAAQAWADGVPNGVEVCDADLDGQAVLLPADAGTTVRALPVEAMPASPAVRFGLLFGVKPAWSMRELAPYLTEMVPPGKTAEALVLQYARCVVANDGTYTYMARA
jgi:sister chromatid cohesion protein DCC1